jgi:hypothetical protein
MIIEMIRRIKTKWNQQYAKFLTTWMTTGNSALTTDTYLTRKSYIDLRALGATCKTVFAINVHPTTSG